jgi:hypothetical protein
MCDRDNCQSATAIQWGSWPAGDCGARSRPLVGRRTGRRGPPSQSSQVAGASRLEQKGARDRTRKRVLRWGVAGATSVDRQWWMCGLRWPCPRTGPGRTRDVAAPAGLCRGRLRCAELTGGPKREPTTTPVTYIAPAAFGRADKLSQSRGGHAAASHRHPHDNAHIPVRNDIAQAPHAPRPLVSRVRVTAPKFVCALL